jgi:hypothetical protein
MAATFWFPDRSIVVHAPATLMAVVQVREKLAGAPYRRAIRRSWRGAMTVRAGAARFAERSRVILGVVPLNPLQG